MWRISVIALLLMALGWLWFAVLRVMDLSAAQWAMSALAQSMATLGGLILVVAIFTWSRSQEAATVLENAAEKYRPLFTHELFEEICREAKAHALNSKQSPHLLRNVTECTRTLLRTIALSQKDSEKAKEYLKEAKAKLGDAYTLVASVFDDWQLFSQDRRSAPLLNFVRLLPRFDSLLSLWENSEVTKAVGGTYQLTPKMYRTHQSLRDQMTSDRLVEKLIFWDITVSIKEAGIAIGASLLSVALALLVMPALREIPTTVEASAANVPAPVGVFERIVIGFALTFGLLAIALIMYSVLRVFREWHRWRKSFAVTPIVVED